MQHISINESKQKCYTKNNERYLTSTYLIREVNVPWGINQIKAVGLIV